MDLSESVLAGLGMLGEERHFPQAALTEFMQVSVQALLAKERVDIDALTSKPSLASINPAVLKEAYAAFLTLLLEAARHNADAAAVTAVLEDCKVTGGRVAAITQMIMDALLKNRLLLSKTSFNYPHITDVSWRLDYYIKDDQLEKVNKAVYVIDLQTEANDGAKKDIQFSCTVDQLQDLVAHLKDASRALQNMGQTG